jgi:hypothetical protein
MTPEELFIRNGGISAEEIRACLDARKEPPAMQVLHTLTGDTLPPYRLPWVEPVVEPGMPCDEAYSRMHEAYDRLRLRLGVTDEDADVEQIIDSLMEYGQELALKMFEYGRIFQKQSDNGSEP